MTVFAAIYARISSDPRAEGLGVARQEADCRALAERLGWTVGKVYVDNDRSAFSGKRRAQYRLLLDDVRSGAVTGVIAYAPDRLYRRLADLSEFIDVVRATGCHVQTVAAGEVDLNTAAGRQTAGLLGVIAAGESDRLGERVRRKLAENRAHGKPHGGPRPYGWEADRVTIREAEAEVIREAITQVLGGIPIRAVVRDLNTGGVTNAHGRPWTHATLRGVLTSARHAGLMRDGTTRAGWPEIIPPERYRALLRLVNDPDRVTTPGRAGRLHLLSGLARCAICGGPLRVGTSSSAKRPGYEVYRCPATHVVRNREHVERFVCDVIAARLRRPDAVHLLSEADTEQEHAARQEAEAEAERLRHLIDEAAGEHGRSGLSPRALAAYLAPLETSLAEAEAAASPPADRAAAFGDIMNAADRGAAFLASPVDRQRAIIDMLITITVGRGRRGNVFYPDGIVVSWR